MDTLKPLIEQLVQMIKDGTDIVSGQLPAVATQILAFKAFELQVWLCFFAVLCASSVALWFYAGKECKREGSYSDWSFCRVVLAPIAFMFSIVLFLVFFIEMKQIQMAPKLYLIEFLLHKVKH